MIYILLCHSCAMSDTTDSPGLLLILSSKFFLVFFFFALQLFWSLLFCENFSLNKVSFLLVLTVSDNIFPWSDDMHSHLLICLLSSFLFSKLFPRILPNICSTFLSFLLPFRDIFGVLYNTHVHGILFQYI